MPAYLETVQCPLCARIYQTGPGEVGMLMAKKRWSDGYVEFDRDFGLPRITRCEECQEYFWLYPEEENDNAAHENCRYDYAGKSRQGILPQARELSVEEYAEVIGMRKFRNPAEEIYLRKQLWWAINDLRRYNGTTHVPKDMKILFDENLESLIYKTPADSPENLLALAEMHRELGLFREAAEYLDKVKGVRFTSYRDKIRDRINIRDTNLFNL